MRNYVRFNTCCSLEPAEPFIFIGTTRSSNHLKYRREHFSAALATQINTHTRYWETLKSPGRIIIVVSNFGVR